MLGERSDQRGFWEADYLDHVGKDTFYGLLASLRGQLFRDWMSFGCIWTTWVRTLSTACWHR